jgi:hypothetical protein
MHAVIAKHLKRVNRACVGRFDGYPFDCVVSELLITEDRVKKKNRQIKKMKTAMVAALEAMRKNIAYATLKDEPVLVDAIIQVQKALKGR